MKLFTVRSRLSDYEVCQGSLDEALEGFRVETDFLLVDKKVLDLYPAIFSAYLGSARLIPLKAAERLKTLAYVISIVDRIMAVGITKRSRIFSFGGGIVQDVTGFGASILFRGLEWHYFPTTLLAQTDSCIGAKTSINFRAFKNLIGTFYNPARVVLIPEFLRELNTKAYLSGLGEVIKLHLIGGPAFADQLATEAKKLLRRDEKVVSGAILKSLEIKKKFIEEDEFDKGVRNLLNYGHCIGHAIESATKYKVPHGQAVTLGMLLANRIAVERKELEPDIARRLEEVLLIPFVQPAFLKLRLDEEAILAGMRKDKKRVGPNLVVVYLQKGGKIVRKDDILEEEVRTQLKVWDQRQP